MLLAAIVPAGIFLACAMNADLSFRSSVDAWLTQWTAERHSLLGVTILGLIPVFLLSLVTGLLRLWLDPGRVVRMGWAGLTAMTAVLVWVNLEFWPGYLPDKAFRGFPHGLEFVIGPVFFAPPAMAVAMVFAWLTTRGARE